MSKTRVNRKVPSVEILFLRHSKANIAVPSAKQYVRDFSKLELSRALSTEHVVAQLARRQRNVK